MRGVRKLVFVFAIAALLALGLSACGGGDSEDSTAGSTAATGQETTTSEDQGSGNGRSHESSSDDDSSADSDEGSGAFRTPGGDNSIQNFGGEAETTEVDAASAVLAGYLQARAEGDWAKACTFLAAAAVAPLEKLASGSPELKGKGCAAILAALSAGAPASTRANTMTDGIASLRIEGDRGFALYHGAKGIDYFVPMAEDDGEWKVATLAPSEFP